MKMAIGDAKDTEDWSLNFLPEDFYIAIMKNGVQIHAFQSAHAIPPTDAIIVYKGWRWKIRSYEIFVSENRVVCEVET